MLLSDHTHRFKKQLKLMESRGKDISKIDAVIIDLVNEIPLSEKYREHPLHNNLEGTLECHIESDWIMVYEINEDTKTILFMDTGTHQDIFGR
jgi:mRNA interferase YafQ